MSLFFLPVLFIQTCGSPLPGKSSCWSSSCGGLGCADSEGQSRCGGEGCDGAVATANNVLMKAQQSEREILSTVAEVEKLSKMVSPAPGLCFQEDCVTVLTCNLSSGV